MKVVCINKEGWFYKGTKKSKHIYFWGLKTIIKNEECQKQSIGPKYGDILDVINTKNDLANFSNETILYYKFNEWPDWLDARGFKPIDQTEEIEAEEKIKELLHGA